MDPIALVEAFFRQNQQARDQVLEQVLRAEAHCDAEHAEACNQWRDGDAPLFGHCANAEDDEDDLQRLDHPVHNGGRERVPEAGEGIFKGIYGARQGPEYGEGDDGLDDAVDVDFDVVGDIHEFQRDIDADDDGHDLERRGDGPHEDIIEIGLGAGCETSDPAHECAGEEAANDQ